MRRYTTEKSKITTTKRSFRANDVKDSAIGTEGATKIFKAIVDHSSLEEINFDCMYITQDKM